MKTIGHGYKIRFRQFLKKSLLSVGIEPCKNVQLFCKKCKSNNNCLVESFNGHNREQSEIVIIRNKHNMYSYDFKPKAVAYKLLIDKKVCVIPELRRPFKLPKHGI